MSEWLGMPKAMRDDEKCKAIVNYWKARTPAPFADAYASYRGSKMSSTERSLIEGARSGDSVAMLELWTQFINSATDTNDSAEARVTISDPKVCEKLEHARTLKPFDRPTAYTDLNDYLEGEVNEYKGKFLYAGQKSGAGSSLGGSFSTGSISPEDQIDYVQEQWQNLAENIRGSAERIWRDLFLDSAADLKLAAPKVTLQAITRTSQLLMLLWLETTLYQDRAYSNFTGRRMSSAKGKSTRKLIRDYVRDYHTTLKRWDTELKRLMAAYKVETYFRTHRLESQQFRRLIRQFADLDAKELGWASQVTDAEAELRYQQRDEMRREFWVEKNPLGYFGMSVLRITTGYGTKPLNFLWTTLAVWGVDAFAFWLNDYFHKVVYSNGVLTIQHFCATSQPHLHQWQDWILEGLRYLYIAITNLTSLGINTSLATYCSGAISEIAVLATTLLGYFMLGLLSAVLYTQLTQRD